MRHAQLKSSSALAFTPHEPQSHSRLSAPPDRAPHPRALRAAQSLLACGQALGILSSNYEVKGHRDVQQTLSPGDRLYDIIQTWPHYRE